MPTSNPETINDTTLISSRSHSEIDNCSLVLSAKNITHTIEQNSDGDIQIIVQSSKIEAARYQLTAFFQENKNWPPVDPRIQHPAFPALLPTLVLIGSLGFFFMITGPWHPRAQWFTVGANDADAILDGGQWYRLITSLTLHADFSHLAGNCLIGGFLIFFFLQINGVGLGLLAIILSGGLGNLINIMAHGTDHLSVGFSTAVFSIIGMLSMYQVFEQRQPFGLRFFVPFMGGAALLAMLGSSGVRTDLGAHFFGLLSGLIFGALLATKSSQSLRHSSFIQILFFMASVLLLFSSWSRALMTNMS